MLLRQASCGRSRCYMMIGCIWNCMACRRIIGKMFDCLRIFGIYAYDMHDK